MNEVCNVIFGALLGNADLRFHRNKNKAYFVENSSDVNYLEYLKINFCRLGPSIQHQKIHSNKIVNFLITKSFKELKEIHKEIYITDQKIFNIKLNPEILLHWFLSAGRIRNNIILLKITDYSNECCEKIVAALSEIGIKSELTDPPHTSTKYIKIDYRYSFDFLDLVGECPIESKKYLWQIDEKYRLFQKYKYSTGDVSEMLKRPIARFTHNDWFKDKIDFCRIGKNKYFSRQGIDQFEKILRSQNMTIDRLYLRDKTEGECFLCKKEKNLKFYSESEKICGSCYKKLHLEECICCKKMKYPDKRIDGRCICGPCNKYHRRGMSIDQIKQIVKENKKFHHLVFQEIFPSSREEFSMLMLEESGMIKKSSNNLLRYDFYLNGTLIEINEPAHYNFTIYRRITRNRATKQDFDSQTSRFDEKVSVAKENRIPLVIIDIDYNMSKDELIERYQSVLSDRNLI